MNGRKATDGNNGASAGRLWAGWWLAGLAWALHLTVGWTIVDWYCHNRTALSAAAIHAILNMVSLAAIILAVAGIALAWRNWQRLDRTNRKAGGRASGRTDRPNDRSGFMAVSGILLSCFFLGIVLMQSVPNLIFRPCQ